MLHATLSRRALVEVTRAPARAGGVIATATFNTPASRNAMTVALGDEFQAAVAGLRADPEVRALVVAGAGPAAFSAGGDMAFLTARTAARFDENVAEMRAFYSRFLCVRQLPVPVVAAINGHAIGAGLCFALACDYRVVSAKARLGVNFTRLGIHPGMGATFSLPRLVGHAHATRLIVGGGELTPDDALRIGLAHELCPDADATRSRAAELAAELAGTTSPVAVAESLATLRGPEAALEAALQREAEAQARCYAHNGGADLLEAIAAMKERRSPAFKP